jgi:hypothetical protein
MARDNKRADRVAADEAMIAGIQKVLAKQATLTFGSQTMTPAQIVQIFQDRVSSSQAVVDADAAKKAAVKADRDTRAKTGKSALAFRRFVLAMFSESPDTLATFGLTAPKAAKKTVQVKAQAAAKGKATRSARHTVGSKQRQAIHATPPEAGTTSTPAHVDAAAPPKPTA